MGGFCSCIVATPQTLYNSVNVPDSLEFTPAVEVATYVPEVAVINVNEKTPFEALASSGENTPEPDSAVIR